MCEELAIGVEVNREVEHNYPVQLAFISFSLHFFIQLQFCCALQLTQCLRTDFRSVLPRSVGDFHLQRLRISPTFPYSIFLNFPLLFKSFPYIPYKTI